MNVRGATVLVTGDNRGIGAAYARALLDAGAAKVYGAARDPASVSDADVVAVRTDVTNDTEVAAADESCPDVSIVVNNTGIGFAVSALGYPLRYSSHKISWVDRPRTRSWALPVDVTVRTGSRAARFSR